MAWHTLDTVVGVEIFVEGDLENGNGSLTMDESKDVRKDFKYE